MSSLVSISCVGTHQEAVRRQETRTSGCGTRRSKSGSTFRVSRGLVTMTPTLSRQVPYALHTHDGVTSGNVRAEA